MRTLAILCLLILMLAGCGGGGSGSGSGGGQSHQFNPGQPLVIPIASGNVTLPGDTYGAVCNVAATESPAPNIEQDHKIVDQQKLTLTLPGLPNSTIAVSYPDTHPQLGLGSAMLAGNIVVGGFPAIRQNGRVIVQLDPELIAAAQNPGPKVQGKGASVVISLLLTFLTVVNSPDQTPSLEQVGLETDKSHVAIFSHGLMQQGSDMTPSAQTAQARANYSAVYVYHYNDQEPIAQAAHDLATLVRQLHLDPKSADLYGYSKGALVNLKLLVGEGETLAFKRAIFLAGPFEGCQLDLFGLYLFLNTAFFATNVDVPLIGSPHENCLEELMPGSDALMALAGATNGQHGDVDYYFFAGGADNVVSNQSATFSNGEGAANLTNGHIHYAVIPNQGHLAMDEPDVVATAINQMAENQTGVSIWSTVNGQVNNVVYADPLNGSWYYDIVVRNNTGENVTVLSLQIEGFDRFGNWTTNQWYDPSAPNGQFFPFQYTPWNQPLLPTAGVGPIHFQSWASGYGVPVWSQSVPDSNKAVTVHFILLAVGQSGRPYRNEWDVGCRYANFVPVWPPHTRIVQGGPSGTQSPTGLAHR